MKRLHQKAIFVLAFALLLPVAGRAGAFGNISGFVKDKETNVSLPGANIVVEGTNFGAKANKHGYYIIYNLPVGKYNLRVSMIGYSTLKLTEVEVKTDLNTSLEVALTSRVLNTSEEIVVTAPRVQILRDVLSSTQYLNEETISQTTPGLTYYDKLALVPGFVANHMRGSRSSNVQYLIDGLPASGAMTREAAFTIPTSAIAEMVVHTGGFSAEYGNVTSGVINIITREGRNDFFSAFKLAQDLPARRDWSYDNARRAEFALGGPLKLGLGGPLIDANYLVSGSAYLTDTPFRKELRRHFHSPIFSNYDLNSKLMLRLSSSTFLRWQGLFSSWQWRQYDEDWAERISALPKRSNKNSRMDLSVIQTLSAEMFYKIELSYLDLRRQISGESAAGEQTNVSFSNEQSLPAAWGAGSEPWRENLRERQLLSRFSLVRQLSPVHQFKIGVESNWWQISLARDRFLLWPDGRSAAQLVYSRYQDSFKRNPYALSAYFHHKIELPGFLATLGLRTEYFSANAKPALLPSEHIVAALNDSIATPRPRHDKFQLTFAPRLGIAIPIGNIEHLALNYGWFYELPAFYYLYTNPEGNVSARWPIFGNTNIKPIRAKAWELTYRRVLAEHSTFSLTGFLRDFDNLIDTFPHDTQQNAADDKPQTVFRYENRAKASTSGIEAAYWQRFGRKFTTGLSYTYLTSTGTGSWPEATLLSRGRHETTNAYWEEPLAWDQRHAFKLNFAYHTRSGYLVSLLSRINGPATAVEWLSDARTELGWRHFLDLKVSAPVLHGLGLNVLPFLEVRNLLDQRSVDPEQGGIDFSQPSLEFEEHHGRRIWVGISYNK